MQEALKSFEFSFRHMMNDLQFCSHQIEGMCDSDAKFRDLLNRVQELNAKLEGLDERVQTIQEQEKTGIDANQLLINLKA